MRTIARSLMWICAPALLLLLVWQARASAPGFDPPDPALRLFDDRTPALLPGTHLASVAALSTGPAIPSWSRIAFQRYVNEQWDVYVADGAGGTRAVVTSAGDDRFPALDRGGQRLAYTSSREGMGSSLYMADADGRNERLLVGDQVFTAFPAWSPDGRSLVYQGFLQGQYDLFLIDIASRARKRLTLNRAFDGEPAWSPDGRQIVFTTDRDDGVLYLYVMNADGTGQRRLNSEPYSLHPSWSPDGRRIGFDADSDSDGWQELAIMNADGSDVRVIYDPGPRATAWAGSWSPDGRYLSFTEVEVDFRNGNWVWVRARLRQWDSQNNTIAEIVSGNQDWYVNWQTTDIIPPDSRLAPLPPYTRAGPLVLSWTGSDRGGAGLRHYDIYSRQFAGQPWELQLGETTQETYTLQGVPGQVASFLTRATDAAWNTEPQRDALAQQTTFFHTTVTGRLTDNRNAPLSGVTVALQPDPLFELATDATGRFNGYTVLAADHALLIRETNFLTTPSTLVSGNADFERDFYLLPAGSVIRNGQFEDQPGMAELGWEIGGDLPLRQTDNPASGETALQMGPAQTAQGGTAVLAQSVMIPGDMAAPTLAFMSRQRDDVPGDATYLQVVISSGDQPPHVEPFSSTETWSLHWLDMEPWRGRTATLTFYLRQDAADPPLTVWLDDISLGPAGSDLWLTMSAVPERVLPGGDFHLSLHYGNRGTQQSGNVDVRLTLPPGFQLLNAEPAGLPASEGWGWALGEVPPASESAIQVLLRANAAALREPAPLHARLSGSAFEGLLSNNAANLFVEQGAQVFIPKIGAPAVQLTALSTAPGSP